MNAEDFGELVKAVGPIAAFMMFVFWVLAKNGLLRVIIRDSDDNAATDERTSMRKDITKLQIEVAYIKGQLDHENHN